MVRHSADVPEDIMEEFEELLLQASRNGDATIVRELLQAKKENRLNFHVDCKGRTKSNYSWTPLHLACYFGHENVAELLLQNGADVNVLNDSGDTPLHKAAFTGRESIVTLLLRYNADVSPINGEGQTPKDVALVQEICKLLEGVEKTETRRKEDQLLHASREGDIELLNKLLHAPSPTNINCVDVSGNTALHCAAYREKKEAAVILLQNGIDSTICNQRGQTALELARSVQMKQILDVKPIKTLARNAVRFEGSLMKRSRFLGWQSVWVVLERGVLTYFKTRADSCSGVKRRGFKHLDGAKVFPLELDRNAFVVNFSDNTMHRLSLPSLTEENGVSMQKWMNAIKEHIDFCNHFMTLGHGISDLREEKGVLPLGSMQDALQTAEAHHQILQNHVASISNVFSVEKHKNDALNEVQLRLGGINDAAKVMVNSLGHCLTIFRQQDEVRQLQLKQEQEKCRFLEEAFQALAVEHRELEHAVDASSYVSPFHTPLSSRAARSPRFYETSDDEFYDAFEGGKSEQLR